MLCIHSNKQKNPTDNNTLQANLFLVVMDNNKNIPISAKHINKKVLLSNLKLHSDIYMAEKSAFACINRLNPKI